MYIQNIKKYMLNRFMQTKCFLFTTGFGGRKLRPFQQIKNIKLYITMLVIYIVIQKFIHALKI